jgi:hypothetical protein
MIVQVACDLTWEPLHRINRRGKFPL